MWKLQQRRAQRSPSLFAAQQVLDADDVKPREVGTRVCVCTHLARCEDTESPAPRTAEPATGALRLVT